MRVSGNDSIEIQTNQVLHFININWMKLFSLESEILDHNNSTYSHILFANDTPSEECTRCNPHGTYDEIP